MQIDENCKVENDEEMLAPNGNVKICRVLTLQLNQTNVLDIGPVGMVQLQQRKRSICIFSRSSYETLCAYINAMRAGVQRTCTGMRRSNSSSALAMALVIGMLGALSTNDTDDD